MDYFVDKESVAVIILGSIRNINNYTYLKFEEQSEK
jgi:hypothetical protein